MSNFEDDLMHGYTKHTKVFDNWCEKARPLLGEVRQCVMIELCRDGSSFIAANAPDIGEQNLTKKWYDHVPEWSFYKNPKNEITTGSSHFGYENSKIFTEGFRISWFSYREIIDNDTQLIYSFNSNSPNIYEKLIQNLATVKKFLKFFKSENEAIFDYHRERKFNLAERSTNYFKINNDTDLTERENLNMLLQQVGILKANVNISRREWQCIKMLEYGKTAKETGEILGLSRRTVESFFSNIKNKLRVNTKSQILAITN